MVELLTSGAMSNRMLLLIFASFFSIFPAMFLIFGIMMRRGEQNNISRGIVALLLMIFPLIFLIASFFIKGQAVFTPAN